MGMCLGIDIYQKGISKEVVDRYMPDWPMSDKFGVVQETANHISVNYEGSYTGGVDIQNRLWFFAAKESSEKRPLCISISDYEEPESYYVLKNGAEPETDRIHFYREISNLKLTDAQTWGLDR